MAKAESVINGVILQKLQSLDQVLAELRSLGAVSVDQLRGDWRTRRAIERDTQVLVEVVIDVCQRLIALSGQTPAPTSADAIERCIEIGAISDFAAYRQMVQFRIFIVHRYERIDEAILVQIIQSHLCDFERFRQEVLAHVRR